MRHNMKKSAESTWSRKDEKRQLAKILVIVILAVSLGVFAFLKFYSRYNDRVLYAERLSQMQEVTAQLFTGLEDVINTQWKTAKVQSNYIANKKPESVGELTSLMQEQMSLSELDEQLDTIVAVDSSGLYYTQDGARGKIGEINYLVEEPERISFVSNSMTGNETRMLFLQHLSEPVTILSGDKEVQINYAGISYNMKELNSYFNCNAYDGNNCVYVIDSDGMKLFRNSGGEELLQGHNAYSVLKKMKYLHGSAFDTTLKELEEHKTAYSNAVLNGKEYYYALYQMENSEWTLLFMVDSDYVATNTVELVDTTVRLILAFAVVMLVCCSLMIFWTLKIKQKQVIESEKKNADKLAQMNAVLDQKNTELAHAASVAEDASKAKTDFLANMSHDIRTPMNAIVGITSLMEHEPGMTDKMETYIQKVQLSSRHLLGLINDILDMSRIESNEVQLNAEEVSLAEQMEQIDSIIRAQVNEHEQHFHIHVNEIVHEYLVCDGVRLRQICLNLLSNAVKYTPKGGDIILELTEVPCDVADHAKFVYTVIDNGYGMSQEFLEHIFEPFTRAENSMTNKVQGTGLGMAITKNIVDLMGGEIHVESQLGKGSRFEVVLTLPINRNVDYEIGVSRVLLVSSEEQLIRNVKAAMSESAVQFYAVSTEEEAAGWLMQESTDVILLAGCLQNKTLDETVNLLRQIAKNAVLIFCLDFASEEDVQDLLAGSGVDGMILRPFFLSNLAVAIARTRTASVSEEEESHILNSMNFLCAEDNELNAEILKELLHMYGASCTIYPDGEKIVEAFKSVKPDEYDAILMDVQMPNMNGLEATRAIRSSENPLGKTIPIIAMTANAFSEDVQHCLGAGMDAHIAKPLDIEVLEKTLRGFSVGGGQTKPKNKMR